MQIDCINAKKIFFEEKISSLKENPLDITVEGIKRFREDLRNFIIILGNQFLIHFFVVHV